MAAMSTTLVAVNNKDNYRKYTYTGHTALNPKHVIETRQEAIGNKIVQEDTFIVSSGCVDVDGNVLPQRVSFSVTVRRPISRADDTEVTAALAILRDIVAGDEFGNTVATQQYLV